MKRMKIAINAPRRERVFLGQQMDEARSGITRAVRGVGRSVPRIADPRRWVPRHPAIGPLLLVAAVAAAGTAAGFAINHHRRSPHPRAGHGAVRSLFSGLGWLVRGSARVARFAAGRGVIGVTIADLVTGRASAPADREDEPSLSQGSYDKSA
jgi:hypothetical protein